MLIKKKRKDLTYYMFDTNSCLTGLWTCLCYMTVDETVWTTVNACG